MSRWKAERSRAGLLLIEMIIAIGVFSLSCAACVQMFAAAQLLNVESRELSKASLCAQSAAEAFKAADGSMEKTAEYLGAAIAGDHLFLAYNSDWKPWEKSDETNRPSYRMTLSQFEADGMLMAKISVGKPVYLPDGKVDKGAQEIIYSLNVKALAR